MSCAVFSRTLVPLLLSCLCAGTVTVGAQAHSFPSSRLHHNSRQATRTAQLPAHEELCYRSTAGLIFLKQNGNHYMASHKNGFAPIGEAVFRSRPSAQACPYSRIRRG
ncbi:hypothetical protein GMO_13960 [Gluconobacter morbifer G707]|uniref:Secreted protein n=1 Tax=Gluconobacter morbifer G707 TaxID=1088869 RepID=G6XII6_9PROT|nr:hypothetical protein GMO_13960 [Gluconobacter morbifer G707]